MESKRTIIAIVLIMVLWSAYTIFFTPKQSEQNVVTDDSTATEVVPAKQESASASAAVDSTLPVAEQTADIPHRQIKVISDNYVYILDSMGASVSSVELTRYKETHDEDSADKFLFSDENPNTFTLSGSDGLYFPESINYALLEGTPDEITINNDSSDVVFVATVNGVQVTKTYRFNAANYNFDLLVGIVNISDKIQQGRINLSHKHNHIEDDKSQARSFYGPVSYSSGKLIEDKTKNLDTAKIYPENTVWSGYMTKYFISAVAPVDNFETVRVSYNQTFVENLFTSKSFSLNPGNASNFSYSAYIGPKEIEHLTAADHNFVESIHYGFLQPLSKPLMSVLRFFYSYLGNYGFAIILLTVCIKLIFWPLTQKSYKSMRGMQKLQPEMKKIREKFASDKQKMNQEIMKFYKEQKVSPLGGCLPMVIQIPVFFALYSALMGAIELRHAPFLLWITDLSAKDPYYVTPIIMGVTMFLQQKMTPTSLDPTQEKLMLFMPIIFTVMFLNFPSGLVVYWLINNLLTILQQYLIRRQTS